MMKSEANLPVYGEGWVNSAGCGGSAGPGMRAGFSDQVFDSARIPAYNAAPHTPFC
jgi:hypothetical protein